MSENEQTYGLLALAIISMIFFIFILPMHNTIVNLEDSAFSEGKWECQEWEDVPEIDLIDMPIHMGDGEFCVYRNDGYCYYGETWEYRREITLEIPKQCLKQIWVSFGHSDNGDGKNEKR